MVWKTTDEGFALFCNPRTPIASVTRAMIDRPGPLYIIDKGTVQGAIFDCQSLVRDHAYPESPLPIGSLLTNAVRAFLLATASPEVFTRLASAGKIEMRDASQRLIAWLKPTSDFLTAFTGWSSELPRAAYG